RGVKILPRRQMLDVIVLFVRATDQVGSAFERFIDQENRLAWLIDAFRPIDAERTQISGWRFEELANFVFLHGTRFFSSHCARELGFIHLVITTHQQHDCSRYLTWFPFGGDASL